MKRLLFLLAFSPLLALAQEFPTRTINMEEVNVLGKKTRFKKVGLYDENLADKPSIKGFTQLEIFTDAVTDEVWTVKNATCIGIQPETDPKDAFLKLYKGFYLKRKEIPKSNPKNYILKIILKTFIYG